MSDDCCQCQAMADLGMLQLFSLGVALIPPSLGKVSPCPVPLQSIGSVYSGLMQGVGAAEKVFEFIDRKPTMVHDGSLAPDHVDGKVEFRNVTFSYRTRSATQVLQVSPVGTACSQHHGCCSSLARAEPQPLGSVSCPSEMGKGKLSACWKTD